MKPFNLKKYNYRNVHVLKTNFNNENLLEVTFTCSRPFYSPRRGTVNDNQVEPTSLTRCMSLCCHQQPTEHCPETCKRQPPSRPSIRFTLIC